MTGVVLEVIDASNWQEALSVRVRDDQLAFVADHQPVALVILAKCFVRPGDRRWEPLLIRDEHGLAVGVLGLVHGTEACEVRNFAIDAERQREGLGAAAVGAVVDHVRRSGADCRELLVSAHRDNRAAHRTYLSAGLVQRERDRDVEVVFSLDLERIRSETPAVATGCYACDQSGVDAPFRERFVRRAGWRVAHDFNSSLEGWLILAPLRHVQSLDELTSEEATTLGALLQESSVALKAVTGCTKTYVMLFAEAEGFAHLHVHVVPRMADQPLDRRGPRVFGHLGDGRPVAPERRDEIARALLAAWPS